jgi:6-pyruvoyl-tetrahydropterin synthase
MEVVVEVARRYQFNGEHHVPGLPLPWCDRHTHRYTVEVVARGSDTSVVVDTDLMDHAWDSIFASLPSPGHVDVPARLIDLDIAYGPQWTTVESLSQRWLREFYDVVPEVVEVSVWEDMKRRGTARWR